MGEIKNFDVDVWELKGTGTDRIDIPLNDTGYYVVENLTQNVVNVYDKDPNNLNSTNGIPVEVDEKLPLPKCAGGTKLWLQGNNGEDVRLYYSPNKFPDSFFIKHPKVLTDGDDLMPINHDGADVDYDFHATHGKYARYISGICPGEDITLYVKLRDEATALGSGPAHVFPAGEPFNFPPDGVEALIDSIKITKTGSSLFVYGSIG